VSWTQIEGVAYWSLFVAAFLGVAVWESFRTKRPLTVSAGRRWGKHGILYVVSAVITALVLRVNPVFTAALVAHNRFGLLNKDWIPFAVRCVLTVLVLDFVKYAVHRAHHSWPLLWRVHQVHHSDPDFDVSTAGRAHPIEVLLTQGVTLTVIVVLAPPMGAVLTAELLACFQSFFEHANAALPPQIERWIRSFLVTPDLHRVHHSREVCDQFRNLGEVFPWWDKLFGSYSAAPQAGEEAWTPGLEGLEGETTLGVRFMLEQPLRTPPSA
jgi:sterol desaturase/sphingolipid hydroxylase (fatty acid hydroxylase superfamily)